jgi:hypothetical protein
MLVGGIVTFVMSLVDIKNIYYLYKIGALFLSLSETEVFRRERGLYQ